MEKIKVKLHRGETIIHQCAHAALAQGRDLRWFRRFLARVENIRDLDKLLKYLLSEFDISTDDDLTEDL